MKTNSKGFAIAILLLAIALLIAGALYLSTQHHAQATTPSIKTLVSTAAATSSDETTPVASGLPGITCYQNSNYFIITKDNAPNVGTDLLVKYKTSSGQHLDCNYAVAPGDYEIKNGDGAQYYLALAGNFLLTDNGTAPDPRVLGIFDLTKRTQVFTDYYSKPITIQDSIVSYWAPSKEKATAANCPNLAKFRADGLGAAIEMHMNLDLPQH